MAEVNFLVKKGLTVPQGSASTPAIIFDASDPNTGIYSPAADHLAISTNGTGRLFIDSSGKLLVGTSSARTNYFNTTLAANTAGLQLEGNDGSNRILSVCNNSTGTAGPIIVLGKSNSDTIPSYGLVSQNTNLGRISWQGADGSELVEAASIAALVDDTPGADDMPGRLVFSTTADGAASPTERARITSDGYLRLASGSGGIQFNGDTAAANALDDYEEGSWTPVHSDGTNTATLSGLYRKIGNFVFFRVAASGTGTLKVGSVSGLPFVNIATIVGVGGKVTQATAATSDISFIGYNANPAVINLNLAADVSVTTNFNSWICTFTAVVF